MCISQIINIPRNYAISRNNAGSDRYYTAMYMYTVYEGHDYIIRYHLLNIGTPLRCTITKSGLMFETVIPLKIYVMVGMTY